MLPPAWPHAVADLAQRSVMLIVHHGAVVTEWGDTFKRNQTASIGKSFLSALIGIAIADRKILLDSTPAKLGMDDNPPLLSSIEKTATILMLLQTKSRVYHPTLYETVAMVAQPPTRGGNAPITFG